MSLPLLHNDPGPILTYLERLRRLGADDHVDQVFAAVRTILSTDDGRMLLDLLEKSTSLLLTPVISDERALFARNAQAFIASDLRRILSNEREILEQRREGNAGRGVGRKPG